MSCIEGLQRCEFGIGVSGWAAGGPTSACPVFPAYQINRNIPKDRIAGIASVELIRISANLFIDVSFEGSGDRTTNV